MLALASLAACSLDARDLSAFRDTASGPDKLRAVLRSDGRDSSLRALAALELLALPRKDVDGRALLFEELAALPARERAAILPAFTRGLSLRMRTEPGSEPSASAVLAKDAGVKLLGLLGQRERAELGRELLAWQAADVPRRADRGEFSLEAVAGLLGPESARALLGALSDTHAPESVARIAAALDAHAVPADRARAAQRLVELEQAYRAGAGAGDSQAAFLAERELVHLLLPALGRFAGEPLARARLLQVARDEQLSFAQRKLALELLEGHASEADVADLLALALSERAAPELRRLALARAGETRSKSALPGLLTLLANREQAELRQRAGELVLEIGGSDALASFFRSLPSAWDMAFDRREIDAYGERLAKLSADPPLVALLGSKLHSGFWYNRVLALRFFAQRGLLEDIWRIRQHVYDPLPVFGAGWPKDHTVGLEAESALALASERLHAAGATGLWLGAREAAAQQPGPALQAQQTPGKAPGAREQPRTRAPAGDNAAQPAAASLDDAPPQPEGRAPQDNEAGGAGETPSP